MKPHKVDRLAFVLASLAGLLVPTSAFGADHVVPRSENIPCVLWTRGCTPTSASMVLGYWDRGDAGWEWLGMGRLIDYWREYTYYSDGTGPLRNVPNILEELRVDLGTDGSGGTSTGDISSGIKNTANARNGYDFSSDQTTCNDWFLFGNDWCWDTIRSEIDDGRPFVWSVGVDDQVGHSLAAWGYTDAKYVITYNTWQCPGRDDRYYSQYDNGSDIDWGYVHTVVPGGWTWGQTSLTYPNGGETWLVSGTYNISWYESDDRTWSANLFYSLDGGVNWTSLTLVEPSSPGWKSYAWKVPSTVTPTTKARIRIQNWGGSSGAWVYQAGDGSESNFTIVKPTLTVTAPNGGEQWHVGESRNITWTSSNAGSYVKIELSRNAGATWSVIASSAPNTSSYGWIVNGPDSTACRVRVTSTSYPDGTDTSGANFTIVTPALTVTAPNGGEQWFVGETKNVTWTSSNAGSVVKIELSRDSGVTWSVITGSVSNTGSYSWTVSAPASAFCRIRVTSMSQTAATDLSNGVFAVAATVSIADASTAEGNAGTRILAFTVTLSAPSNQAVSVVWATVEGTAKAGADFVAGSSTLTFAPGGTSRTVNVGIVGDRAPEPAETFEVALSSPVGAALGRSVAAGRILNDDYASRDLDGDGRSDILWRHTGGALYVWQMNGTSLAASGYLSPIALGWQIQGIGDFNADGKADILWRHTSGATYVWFMSGSGVIGQGYTAGQPDSTWQVQGVGDFDGDGKADILWRHTSGALYVWLMDRTNILSSGYLSAIDPSWQIRGIGDFNGDNRADILWRETTSGTTYVWLMNGATTIGSGYTASQADNSWLIQGTGDLDGDGRSDIVWRHTGGALYVWQMDGIALKMSSYLPPISLQWTVKQLGDFNGDGRADILWRESVSGATYEWLMNGSSAIGMGYSASQTDNTWVIQGGS